MASVGGVGSRYHPPSAGGGDVFWEQNFLLELGTNTPPHISEISPEPIPGARRVFKAKAVVVGESKAVAVKLLHWRLDLNAKQLKLWMTGPNATVGAHPYVIVASGVCYATFPPPAVLRITGQPAAAGNAGLQSLCLVMELGRESLFDYLTRSNQPPVSLHPIEPPHAAAPSASSGSSASAGGGNAGSGAAPAAAGAAAPSNKSGISPPRNRGASVATLRAGPPLRDWVRRLQLLAQTAKALSVLHDLNHVHGELSPAHVLILPNTTIRLVGFRRGAPTDRVFGGDSKSPSNSGSGSAGSSGSGGGGINSDAPDWIRHADTGPDYPAYIAPELWTATPVVTVASDIYAFGMLCAEVLLGCTPWSKTPRSHTPLDVSSAAAHVRAGDVPHFSPRDVPSSLARLVLLVKQCLEHSPARRPSLLQMTNALNEHYLCQGPNPTAPSTRFVKAIRAYRLGNPVTAMLTITSLLTDALPHPDSYPELLWQLFLAAMALGESAVVREALTWFLRLNPYDCRLFCSHLRRCWRGFGWIWMTRTLRMPPRNSACIT
jgi:hypothetical protein